MLEPLEDDRFRRANTEMPLQLARYAFELERRIILDTDCGRAIAGRGKSDAPRRRRTFQANNHTFVSLLLSQHGLFIRCEQRVIDRCETSGDRRPFHLINERQ